MPRRAKSLLDQTIEPTQKKNARTIDKRYEALFLVSTINEPGVRHEHRHIIEATNSAAALKIARQMCHNPMIFPPGTVARIPEKNITVIEVKTKLRSYDAVFEIYRKGNMNSRPHLIRKKIEAKTRLEAFAKAKELCSCSLGFASASDTVLCPLKNIRFQRV